MAAWQRDMRTVYQITGKLKDGQEQCQELPVKAEDGTTVTSRLTHNAEEDLDVNLDSITAQKVMEAIRKEE